MGKCLINGKPGWCATHIVMYPITGTKGKRLCLATNKVEEFEVKEDE